MMLSMVSANLPAGAADSAKTNTGTASLEICIDLHATAARTRLQPLKNGSGARGHGAERRHTAIHFDGLTGNRDAVRRQIHGQRSDFFRGGQLLSRREGFSLVERRRGPSGEASPHE